MIRRGSISLHRLTLEVKEHVLVPEDRPVVEEILRAGNPSAGTGRFDRAAVVATLVEIGITGPAWRSSGVVEMVKRPLAALRAQADAPKRAAEIEAQRVARAALSVRTTQPSSPVGQLKVVEAAPQQPDPIVITEPAVTSPALPSGQEAPPVAATAPSPKRGYVRKTCDCMPRVTPTVIERPFLRDVAVHGLMVLVLDVLAEMFEEDMPFIPAIVMQEIARAAFSGWGNPAVGITKMQYKGYVTNLASPNALAVWRVERVDVGEVTVPEEGAFSWEDAVEIVRKAFGCFDYDDGRALAAFERAVASVSDGRYAAYRY